MGYTQFSFLLFLCFCLLSFSSSIPHPCRKDQSISLLKFKKTFTIGHPTYCPYQSSTYPKTSSWNVSRDCCSWDGVTCDEMTGHVIELDLSRSQLVVNIDSNSSLFQLSHLQRLDLSKNNFSNSHISPEFGRFSTLTHLNLSDSSFSGQIPFEISHISRLQSLRFSTSYVTNLTLAAHDFKLLLQNLTQLTELYLSYVNISSTIPLNFSSHLTTLKLGGTGLYGIIPESIFHLPNLETLDLHYSDQLSGSFPKTKWNSSASLIELDLISVNFSVKELEFLRSAKQLQELDISNNKIQGRIPDWAWSNWMFSLFTLNISHNMLTSVVSIPLQYVETIDLRSNLLQGSLPVPPNTSSIFFISQNNLSGEIPSSVCNSTSLQILDLSRNNLSGEIPQCLGNITGLEVLDMRHNNLSGNLPRAFSNG
ncbi:putative LRR receptor-like serine/threonine-protein kinase-like [Capsicum annuum]|nr:putative LRR receptor-like serine/threonine-protein kinase-like [Capsicum annuum]